MYKIAICDREARYRRNIIDLISKYEYFKEEAAFYEYESGDELLNDSCQVHDLLFLDIQMDGLNGRETARKYRAVNKETVIVFYTSYQRPTIEVFKIQPFRYIIKDLRSIMLGKEIDDILMEMAKRSQCTYLNVSNDGRLIRIPMNSVLYISVMKRGAVIHQYSGWKGASKIICKQSLKEIYPQVQNEGFEYAHYSYIVNLANIVQIHRRILTLKDNTQLSISRSRKKQFDQAVSDFLNIGYKRKEPNMQMELSEKQHHRGR